MNSASRGELGRSREPSGTAATSGIGTAAHSAAGEERPACKRQIRLSRSARGTYFESGTAGTPLNTEPSGTAATSGIGTAAHSAAGDERPACKRADSVVPLGSRDLL